MLGSQVSTLAIPLIAVATLEAGPTEMAFLAGARLVPDILFSLVVGAWVDRIRRRPLLIATDLGRALLLFSLVLAAVAGQLTFTHLYIVAFISGSLAVVSGVAYGSLLPILVSPSQLVSANSRLAMSRSVAGIMGPGLAGLVVQLLSAPIALAVDAVSFVISALFLIRVQARETSSRPRHKQRAIFREIGEGLTFMLANPYLRADAVATAIFGFFGTIISSMFVLYATRWLDVEPWELGIAFALGAPGALAGSLLAGPLARRLGVGITMVTGVFLAALATLLIPLAVPGREAIAFLIGYELLYGLGATLYIVNVESVTQAVTPDELRGRTRASWRFIANSTPALGAAIAGVWADTIGLRALLFIAAVGTLASVVWIIFSPLRTLQDVPEPVVVFH